VFEKISLVLDMLSFIADKPGGQKCGTSYD
jgi:hypothetical protein